MAAASEKSEPSHLRHNLTIENFVDGPQQLLCNLKNFSIFFLKSKFDSRDLFISAYVNVSVPGVAYLRLVLSIPCHLHSNQ